MQSIFMQSIVNIGPICMW